MVEQETVVRGTDAPVCGENNGPLQEKRNPHSNRRGTPGQLCLCGKALSLSLSVKPAHEGTIHSYKTL